MKEEKRIDRLVLCISFWLRRRMDNVTAPYGISGSQARIIGFISKTKGPVYQKDVEKASNLRRSTISEMLTTLEKKGFIIREDVANDARLKKLVLTPKAVELEDAIYKLINENETTMSSNLTAEEKAKFIEYCEKIEAHICNEKGE